MLVMELQGGGHIHSTLGIHHLLQQVPQDINTITPLQVRKLYGYNIFLIHVCYTTQVQ